MTTSADVAALFLTDVGAPTSPGNIRAVSVWLAHENSNPTLRNNPWNLHSPGGLPGQIGSDYVSSGDRDVAVFATIQDGVRANANNLLHLSGTYPQYGTAIDALRADNPTGFLSAIAASPWSAGHYRIGGQVGTNSLLAAYNGTGTYNSVGQSHVSADGAPTQGGSTGLSPSPLTGASLASFQSGLNASLGLSGGAGVASTPVGGYAPILIVGALLVAVLVAS